MLTLCVLCKGTCWALLACWLSWERRGMLNTASCCCFKRASPPAPLTHQSLFCFLPNSMVSSSATMAGKMSVISTT